ncbi:MAG: hypothetical protein ACREQF_01055, partial [Candidatus Binataceae bacterium]
LNRPGEYFGMDKTRKELVGELRGRVLEVGVGNGLNLRHYQKDTFVARRKFLNLESRAVAE